MRAFSCFDEICHEARAPLALDSTPVAAVADRMLGKLPRDVLSGHIAPWLRVCDVARLARCGKAMAEACRAAARLAGVTDGRSALHHATLRQARDAIASGRVSDLVALARACAERPSTPHNGRDEHVLSATTPDRNFPLLIVERPLKAHKLAPFFCGVFPVTGDAERDDAAVNALLRAIVADDTWVPQTGRRGEYEMLVATAAGVHLVICVCWNFEGDAGLVMIGADAAEEDTLAEVLASTEAVWSAARAYVDAAMPLLGGGPCAVRYACCTFSEKKATSRPPTLMLPNGLAFAARVHRNRIWRAATDLDATAATTLSSLRQYGELLAGTRRAMGIA